MSDWECIVVGGGAAGLSAGLVLARARRRVLVIDGGRPSNAVAHGIGGLLGHNERPPGELYAAGRAEIEQHGTVEIRPGAVVAGRLEGDGFALELDDGSVEQAPTVLLTPGMDYRYPQLAGADERWGSSVFHCPFCHGWEVREQPLGLLGAGESVLHKAPMLRAWSDDVTVFTNGEEVSAEAAATLASVGVEIDKRPIAALHGDAPALSSVELEDGAERPLGGLLVPVTLHQRSPLATQLGAEIGEPGAVNTEPIVVDGMLRTTVPGLVAAGDAASQMPSITGAIAAGSQAAAGIVGALTIPGFAGAAR